MLKDYLKLDPWEAIIRVINDSYFTEIQATGAKLVALESLGGTRTKITIDPNIGTSPFNTMPKVEHTVYTYDRLDLATLFKDGPNYELDNVKVPITTLGVMANLTTINDIAFSIDDLVMEQFNQFDIEYTLKAAEGSLRFVGEVKFKIKNTIKRDLAIVTTVVDFLTANRYPLGNDGVKMVGNYFLTSYDFSEFRDELKAYKGSIPYPSSTRMEAIIAKVSGVMFQTQAAPSDYNLCYDIFADQPRLNIVYNGLVNKAYSPRKDINSVLVIQLSPTRCTNMSGFLLLHYN